MISAIFIADDLVLIIHTFIVISLSCGAPKISFIAGLLDMPLPDKSANRPQGLELGYEIMNMKHEK